MKLLQLNVWMGRLTRQILPLIERERPDIITAQELFSSKEKMPFPDRTFNVLELMQQVGRYEHVYFSPICEFDYSGMTIGMGNGIFSKYPLENMKTVFTNGAFQPNGDASIFEANCRNAQIVTVRLPGGRQLHLINHHGYWQPNPVGNEQTVASMQKIVNEVRMLEGPVVLSGDLNIDPGTPAMQLFDGLLEDLTTKYEVTNTLSALGKLQGVAPDHILVSPQVRVRNFRVLDDLVSDHCALVAEFDIQRLSE